MNYIEMRKVIDEIIDGKRDVQPEGNLKALFEWLQAGKKEHEEKTERRMKRLERLTEINAPDIIIQNEIRMAGEHRGYAKAMEDALLTAKCISAFPENFCGFQMLHTIDDSKRRGCRDCMHRYSSYEGGEDFSSCFYCGIKAEYREDEKESLRQGMSACMEDGSVRSYSHEEIEEYISKGRTVLGENGFKGPCDRYIPSANPLWLCSDSEIEAIRAGLKQPFGNPDDEGWDEESAMINLAFCRRNKKNHDLAAERLLKSIFGEDDSEEGEDSGETDTDTETQ